MCKLKFSLIIPVYNVYDYLERCIDSCITQNIPLSEYEIIAIDDGSTDKSLQLLNQLSNKYHNLKVFHKENGGLSSARNLGVKYAKGEYLWFIDSDDFIKTNVLQDLYQIMDNNNLDVVMMDYNTFNIQNKYTSRQMSPSSLYEITDGKDFVSNHLLSCYVPCFIFNRFFWLQSGYVFKQGILFEDLEIIPFILRKAQRLMYYHHIIYNYFIRPNSITNKTNPKIIDSFLEILIKYKKSIEKDSTYKSLLFIITKNFLRYLSNDSYKEKRKTTFQIFRKYKINQLFPNTQYTYRIINWLFNKNPTLILYLYKITGKTYKTK